MPMIHIEYWNGKAWTRTGQSFFNERACWTALGDDDLNYRTIDSAGKVLTDKRQKPSSLGSIDYFRKGDNLL